MREMKDSKGLALRVRSVSGVNAYEGMIEGTPYLVLRWRVLKGQRWMSAGPGRLAHGIGEIEQQLASPGARDRSQDWPPRERWHARLAGAGDYARSTERLLELEWYQEGGDPFARLQEIVSGVDFLSLSTEVTVDRDD